MAVSMSAKLTDKGVKPALDRYAKAITPEKVATTVVRGMVQTFFPQVFESNLYQWPAPLRGGMPLLDTRTHILSAFDYSVSGAVGTVRNRFKYAHIHDKGATITVKNAKYLRFKIRGGGWARKKSVVIPRRRFMYWSASASRFAKGRVDNLLKQARKAEAA